MLNIFKNSTNLKDISYAYANITNIKGDFTVPHNNITNAANCFYGRSNSSQLNIIANFGTASHSAFLVGMTNAGNGQIYSYNNTANIVMFNMQTTNMYNAFYEDTTIAKAACGPNVTDMSYTYARCNNLTGSPVCGPNVTNFSFAYRNCNNLTGNPVCGPKVTNMYYTYTNCRNLTGNPVCGPKVTNMYCAYFGCAKITGNPVCGDEVSDFGFAYYNCVNLTGNPVCGPSIINMYCTYDNTPNLYGDMIVYSNDVSNATDCFNGRNTSKQLTISVNFHTISYNTFRTNGITNGITAFSSKTWTNAKEDGSIYCWNDTANIVIFDMQTTNMANAFKDNSTITKAACGSNVTNMHRAYCNCINLMGSPACGPNVFNMRSAYYDCYNLTGSPVCGNKVTNMTTAYYNCSNLTGSPVCEDNVTDMSLTYYDCKKLTGNPVCGPNVETMYMTYYGCNNLTGSPVCGPNVTSMSYTYYNCKNLGSNGYFYSNKITNVYNCFYGKNKNKRLNLYVPVDGTTLTTCLNTSDAYSLTGTNITWTNDTANNCYYSKAQNIYIYPVANVEANYKENEYKIASYTASKSGVRPIITSDYEYEVQEVQNTVNTSLYDVTIRSEGTPSRMSLSNRSSLVSVKHFKTINMYNSFYNCTKLTGSPVCGPNVTNMYRTYMDCTNLTGSPVCGPSVTDMYQTYMDCTNLTGSPVCGDNVINMSAAYENCPSLTGAPVCGNKVANMTYTYLNCYNLTGSPVCGPNVTDMEQAYRNCKNLSSNGYFFSNKINSVRHCFAGRNTSKRLNLYVPESGITLSTCLNTSVVYSLTGTSITWTKDKANNCHYSKAQNIYICPVANVEQAYKNNELGVVAYTASDLDIRPNIIKSDGTIAGLNDLEIEQTTNSIKIYKKNLNTSISHIEFANNKKLTGINFMTDSIVNMSNSFSGCTNLTGSPVCGNNVTSMYCTYENCVNLTGYPVCGNNVTDVRYAYYNCKNLGARGYFYSNNIGTVRNCFGNRNTSNKFVLYVHENSTTLSTCLETNSWFSLTGTDITWTSGSGYYYNTTYNIYIYPVANVEEAYNNS